MHLGHLEMLEVMVLMAKMVNLDLLDHLDQLEYKERMAPLESKDLKVTQERLAEMDHKESLD